MGKSKKKKKSGVEMKRKQAKRFGIRNETHRAIAQKFAQQILSHVLVLVFISFRFFFRKFAVGLRP